MINSSVSGLLQYCEILLIHNPTIFLWQHIHERKNLTINETCDQIKVKQFEMIVRWMSIAGDLQLLTLKCMFVVFCLMHNHLYDLIINHKWLTNR